MERIPRQFYTKEFKEEAAKLVTEAGLNIAEASRRLSISEQTLRNWIKQLKEGKPLTATRTASELEVEVSRLRRELAEARLERDILKKAMAYLAKEPHRGTR